MLTVAKRPAEEAASGDSGTPKKGHTGAVKIDPNLAEKLVILAKFYGTTVTEMIDPWIRPQTLAKWTLYLKEQKELIEKELSQLEE